MRSLDSWLDEYAFSHQNPVNKTIHRICVPLIFFTIVGFLYCVKIYTFDNSYPITLGHLALAVIAIYYITLSIPLAIGMLLYSIVCIALCGWIQEISHGNLLWVSLSIFIIAWIFQFLGHSVEGKKPSFFKDIEFLMIGPAWVMRSIYQKMHLSV